MKLKSICLTILAALMLAGLLLAVPGGDIREANSLTEEETIEETEDEYGFL